MKCKRTVLPLLGTAFEPGRLADTLNEFEDEELAEIAQAEAYFFSAQAEACVKIVEKYLNSKDVILRMSADMLYTFANLTLGDAMAAQMAAGRCTYLPEKSIRGRNRSGDTGILFVCIICH